MRQTERRLAALESVAPERGLRVFFQDVDDKTLYRDAANRDDAGSATYSAEQLEVLAADGWTVIKVVYG